MAQYLILIYGNEQRWAAMGPDETAHIREGHRAFRAKAGEAILASGQLEPTTRASTLRAASEGGSTVTDGPFPETKEGLGGFYLLEAADVSTVISLARGLAETTQDHSGVEIRPLVQQG